MLSLCPAWILKRKKLHTCLLITDISCKEKYQDEELAKTATAGKPKETHCIFLEHVLFLKTEHSRTINPNTSYIILFKSSWHAQQKNVFGRQVRRTEFLIECQKKAKLNDTDTFWIILIREQFNRCTSVQKELVPRPQFLFNLHNQHERHAQQMNAQRFLFLKRCQKNNRWLENRKTLDQVTRTQSNFYANAR